MREQTRGVRRLTHGAIAAAQQSLDTYRTVSRKELSAAGREAAKALHLRPSVRLVLSELCAVWGEQEWERLVVWPSNDHLVSRTGLSERAVRYAIRDLVALEVVAPKDSANGKRYAVRAPGGAIVEAYGFDLTPIVARRGEWVERIAAQKAEVERRRRSFDAMTVARRSVAEALSALAAHFPEVSIEDLVAAEGALAKDTPRRGKGDPDVVLEAWMELRGLVESRFYSASAGKECRHSENNNGSPTEPCSKGSPGRAEPVRQTELPPALVAEGCPAVATYEPRPILNEVDLVATAIRMRPVIGAHESAWKEACESLGAVRAALLVVIVLQLHDDDVSSGQGRIKNPGGYFRKLVRLAVENRYSPEAEIMAMRRRRMT